MSLPSDEMYDDTYKNDLFRPPAGAYLNTAAESPLLRCVAEALARYAEDKALGEPGRQAFEATISAARRRVAALIEGEPGGVGFCYTASDAVGLLVQSMPWRDGDRVVVSEIEYPSNLLAWSRLAAGRVGLDLVDAPASEWGTEAVLEKIGPRTRLVVVSAVSFNTGRRVDLARLKEAVNRQGGWLLVDATQALGAVRVTAQEADMIVASAFKWMMGVHGLGVVYCRPEVLAALEPPYAGWRSVDAGRTDGPYSVAFKPTAEKFEAGMPGFPALYGLEAGLAYLQDRVGIETVWHRVAALAGALHDRLAALGLPLLTPADAQRSAGIICFRHPDAKRVVRSLRERGVFAHAPAEGVVRFSPHFFNTLTDVAAAAEAVSELVRSGEIRLHGAPEG